MGDRTTPPWKWPFLEWYALPTGPVKYETTVDQETGRNRVAPTLPPANAMFYGLEDPIAVYDKQGRAWRFGQWGDGSWYKELVSL